MKKYKPIISIYATAINTYWWQELYDNLSTSEVPFEMVFCGHKSPDFILPHNFKFIESRVKPAQCNEIAFMNTVGEIVISFVDDMVPNEFFLDNMYKKFIKKSRGGRDDLILISPRQHKLNNTRPIYKCKYYFWPDLNSGISLPTLSMVKRETRERHVTDRRFITNIGELDVAMRLISKGAKVTFCEEAHFYEKKSGSPRRLTGTSFSKKDREAFDSIWASLFRISIKKAQPMYHGYKKFKRYQQKLNESLKEEEIKYFKQKMEKWGKSKIFRGLFDPSEILFFHHKRGILYNKRQEKVTPFLEKDIKLFSQGNKGEWE